MRSAISLIVLCTLYGGVSEALDSTEKREQEEELKDLVSEGCDIKVFKGPEITQEAFIKDFAYQSPFVIRGLKNNEEFRSLCEYDRLYREWGHKTVTLSSANTYSYEQRLVTLRHYMDYMMGDQRRETPGNETFYFFGSHNSEEWIEFLNEYKEPPLKLPLHDSALSFGMGGAWTGVPFHFHGPGFSETISGRKKWFLTRPEDTPEFHPNKTTLQWFLEDYSKVKNRVEILECTVGPGDVIYFPDKWWHAILNLEKSIFMSTFLSP